MTRSKIKYYVPLAVLILIAAAAIFHHLAPNSLSDIGGWEETFPTALSIRVAQPDGSNKRYDVTDEAQLKPLFSLLQDTNVSFVEATDKIPVLYELTFSHRKTDSTEYYHSIEFPGNGYVYADGKMYHISESDEARLLSAIEQLIGSL